MIFPLKSRTRHIAHNPTGELAKVITRALKYNKLIQKRKNRL